MIDDGIVLVKYWFSVSDGEQERRFKDRDNPLKRWKLSDMDIEGRNRWVEYSKAKDKMFAHCDMPDSPWWEIEADDKKRARLNCIAHLLSVVPYESHKAPKMKLPPRPPVGDYERPPRSPLLTSSPTTPRRSPDRRAGPMSVLEVYADIWCPFAYVGLHCVAARRSERGRDDVLLDIRAWPLELVNGAPLDPDTTRLPCPRTQDPSGPPSLRRLRRARTSPRRPCPPSPSPTPPIAGTPRPARR